MNAALETNIAYLPLAYRVAIERLDGMPDRTFDMLRELCDAYAKTYGLPFDEHHDYYKRSAAGIAQRRFGMQAECRPVGT
jgi:hypothetical protein